VDGLGVDVGADELAECGDGNVAASEECDDSNLIAGDGCDSNCTFTACGNGILTAGEICDDGNSSDGDCCSSICAFEVAASLCSDGEPCTVVDACDGLGVCVGLAAPDPTCAVPSLDSKKGSQLKLNDKGTTKDRLNWKWGRGPAASLASFGDPTSSDDFAFCVLVDSGSGAAVYMSALAPAGGKWAFKGSSTAQYKDSALSPDGIKKVQLKAGDAGKAKMKVQGKGTNLDVSGLPLSGSATVTAELRNRTNGTCFSATYSAPFKRNEADRFQAVTD
jgi:cysteine-rich repeat protein